MAPPSVRQCDHFSWGVRRESRRRLVMTILQPNPATRFYNRQDRWNSGLRCIALDLHLYANLRSACG